MVPAGILVLSLGFTALGEEAGDWVYDGGSEECEGDRQSPTNIPRTGQQGIKTILNFIPIQLQKTFNLMWLPATSGLPAIEFPPLEFDHYSSAPEIMVLKNTGPQEVNSNNTSLQVSLICFSGYVVELSFAPFSPTVVPTLSGGGLAHTYNLAKVIFHWGEMAGKGT